MADESSRGDSEPTKADAAASAACTRSGAFALALSMVLILLIPAWMHRPKEVALGHYAAYRFILTLRLDQLDHNPFWQKYSAPIGTVESTPLGSLPNPVPFPFIDADGLPATAEDLKQNHVEASRTESSEVKPSAHGVVDLHAAPSLTSPSGSSPPFKPGVLPPATVAATQASSAPVAPTLTSPRRSSLPFKPGVPHTPTLSSPHLEVDLRIEIPELKGVVDTLNQLNDSDLLTDSRGYSNFYNFSIARWAQRRSELLYRNEALNRCGERNIEEPHKGQVDPNFVARVPPDVLLRCLTLSDVRELAAYEEPTMSNPDPIGDSTGRKIDLNPGALPRDLYAASLVGEALSLFTIMYFAAFAREAMASKGFPTPGTIFSAFSRSRSTLLIMLLAFCTPVASSVGLAVVSRRWPLYAESVLVLLATFSVFLVLQQKSYFSTLNPRMWIQRKAKWTLTHSEASEESVALTGNSENGTPVPSPSPTQPPTATAHSNIENPQDG